MSKFLFVPTQSCFDDSESFSGQETKHNLMEVMIYGVDTYPKKYLE